MVDNLGPSIRRTGNRLRTVLCLNNEDDLSDSDSLASSIPGHHLDSVTPDLTTKPSFWGNPVFHQLLLGTTDPKSSLSRLRGQIDILELIFTQVEHLWQSHIGVPNHHRQGLFDVFPGPAYATIAHVRFPNPSGININMMPFIIGNPKSIPEEYRHHCSLIQRCNIDYEE